MWVRAVVWLALAFLFLSGCTDTRVDTSSASSDRFEEFQAVTEDGVNLYGRIVGSGPDTVIIPLGAWLARDLKPLSRSRTLIFYDLRSRGASGYISDPERLGLDFDVADLEAVRSHFAVERFSLLGWSYLGAVVALYAAEFPQHVKAVVQIGPMAPRPETSVVEDQRGSPPSLEELEHLAQLEEAGLPSSDPVAHCREVAMIQLIRPMMGHPEAASRSKIDPCIYWNEWPNQLFSTLQKFVPAMTGEDWDYTGSASRIQAPVLTIHGTADPNAPVEGGRDWATLIPEAILLEMEGIGHAPWLESPDEFFQAVNEFLSEHGE